jgi:hypothetical protein
MLAALAVVIVLASPTQRLDRRSGASCLALYPAFVAVGLLS